VAYIFADAYASYRKQILKINLFDEYCYLRSQELVSQNEYLLDHPGICVILCRCEKGCLVEWGFQGDTWEDIQTG